MLLKKKSASFWLADFIVCREGLEPTDPKDRFYRPARYQLRFIYTCLVSQPLLRLLLVIARKARDTSQRGGFSWLLWTLRVMYGSRTRLKLGPQPSALTDRPTPPRTTTA